MKLLKAPAKTVAAQSPVLGQGAPPAPAAAPVNTGLPIVDASAPPLELPAWQGGPANAELKNGDFVEDAEGVLFQVTDDPVPGKPLTVHAPLVRWHQSLQLLNYG